MSILSKLPAILSSLALANGVTLPIVLKKSSQTKEKETINLEEVPEKPERKVMPKTPNHRMQQAMSYIDCVQNAYNKQKELTDLIKDKIKQDCRANYWFWD